MSSLACLLLLLPLGLFACPSGGSTSQRTGGNSSSNSSSSNPPQTSNSTPASPAVTSPATSLSVAAVPSSSLPSTTAFDQQRAFAHVSKLVGFGPRPVGSSALARTREYIASELRAYNLKVTIDEFQTATPVGKRRMANIVAELPGERAEKIILASHYDTKAFKEFRFVGANDGGSSTGVLLELARALASGTKRPAFTYQFVFFDGEEAFCANWDDCSKPNAPDNTYGSRRFVSERIAQGDLKSVRAMILLDMIGYKNLELGRDTMSTRWLVDTIWQTAQQLGYAKQFVNREEGIGGDDHEPFLRAGVDSVDLIQLNTYPHWHTVEDTLDKLSPESLKIVGQVVLASLPNVEQRLLTGKR